MTTHHVTKYFKNCIDIKEFEEFGSYYKKLVLENLYNCKELEFEM